MIYEEDPVTRNISPRERDRPAERRRRIEEEEEEEEVASRWSSWMRCCYKKHHCALRNSASPSFEYLGRVPLGMDLDVDEWQIGLFLPDRKSSGTDRAKGEDSEET